MKKSIQNKMSMYQMVQDILKENQPLWESTPKFAAAVENFANKFELLRTMAEKEKAYVVGVRISRDDKRQTIAKKATRISSALFALAVENNNLELVTQMRISESALMRRSQSECILLIDRIIFHALANASALPAYGISTTEIAALEEARADLVVNILSPRKAIIKRKNTLLQIEKTSAELEAILKGGLDKLMVVLKEEHPEFYQAYFDSRMVLHLGGSNSDPTASNF